MKPIFDDQYSIDNGQEIARCRLFHLEEVYINFDKRQYVFELIVRSFATKKYSELMLFDSESNGGAIRKAIEKFDLFCNGWFNS